MKLFGSWDKTDGFIRNAFEGGHDGRSNTLMGGITTLFTPSPDVNLSLTYQHIRERGDTAATPASRNSDLFCAFAGAPGFSPPTECNLPATRRDRGAYTTWEKADRSLSNDTNLISASLDWKLSPALTLTSITGYQQNHEIGNNDFDGSEVDLLTYYRNNRYRQYSQELRLLANVADDINLLIGGFFFDSSYDQLTGTDIGPSLGGPFTSTQFTHHKSRSYAAFADMQYNVTSRLKLSLGGRYTEDKKRIFTNFGQIIPLVQATVPSFTGTECVEQTGFIAPAPGVTLPAYAAASNCSGNASFGKFTWRGNINYTFSSGKMAYASYSTGFRAGGFNGRATSPTTMGPYQPETVDNYEVGLKADWLGRTLRTNIALFYTKYHDKQEEISQRSSSPFASTPIETVVRNAAAATIKGVEVETIMQFSDSLSANTSFSYLDAKYDSFLNDVVGLTAGSAPDGIPDDVSSLRVRRAPKFRWSAGLNYNREWSSGRLDAEILLRYTSKMATCNIPDQPIAPGSIKNDYCLTKDRESLSASAGYTFVSAGGQEMSISIFGRNLTNVHDISGVYPIANLASFSTAITPRVVGVQAGVKF